MIRGALLTPVEIILTGSAIFVVELFTIDEDIRRVLYYLSSGSVLDYTSGLHWILTSSSKIVEKDESYCASSKIMN